MAFYFLLLYLSGDDSELELLQLHQLDNSQASTVVGSPLSSLLTPWVSRVEAGSPPADPRSSDERRVEVVNSPLLPPGRKTGR